MNLPEDLPTGWEVWDEQAGGRVILAYRADVFDGESFDPACMPTIKVSPGRSPDRPPRTRDNADGWHVVLHVEPTVRVRTCDASTETRAAALEEAVDVASEFAAGDIDYRGAYRRPRAKYLERLDALTGGA